MESTPTPPEDVSGNNVPPAGFLRQRIDELSKEELANNGAARRATTVRQTMPPQPPRREKPGKRDAWGIGASLPTGDLD